MKDHLAEKPEPKGRPDKEPKTIKDHLSKVLMFFCVTDNTQKTL